MRWIGNLEVVDEGKPLLKWDSWAQGPYLVEVARQCNFAMCAARELDHAVRSDVLGWRAWYAAQASLRQPRTS